MARQVMRYPPGFKFKPRDDELIIYYLKPKITGEALLCNFIDKVDLYTPDSTPWLLFDVDNPDSWDDDNSLYVFTSLSKVSADPDYTCTKSRCNTNKKAGCGTWVQKTPRAPIKDTLGNVIGGRRMLSFEVNKIGDQFDENKAVYFRMHEYSLWGVNEDLGSDFSGDLVLCKITFDLSKKAPLKLPTKKTDPVSTSGTKAQKKRQSRKNLERTASSTSKTAGVISTSDVVETSTSFNSESLITIDGGVSNDNVGGVQDLEEFCGSLSFDDFDGFGSDEISLESFDADGWLKGLLEEEEILEGGTVHCLGKRKSIEGDNSCQAKKVCF